MEKQKANVNLESLVKYQEDLKEMDLQFNHLYEKAQMSLDRVHESWKDDQFNKYANEFVGTMAKIRQVQDEVKHSNEYIQMIVDMLKSYTELDLK